MTPNSVRRGTPAASARRLEGPRLVDERLADVEEDGLHSHDATSSRSAWVVTFSSLGSPSTTFTRPPRASTSAEQSVASARSPAYASRSVATRKACGV